MTFTFTRDRLRHSTLSLSPLAAALAVAVDSDTVALIRHIVDTLFVLGIIVTGAVVWLLR